MPASFVPVPAKCAKCGDACGHPQPPPMSPEVAHFHDTAAQLFRESRVAFREGKPGAAKALEDRAMSAFRSAARAVADLEIAGARS